MAQLENLKATSDKSESHCIDLTEAENLNMLKSDQNFAGGQVIHVDVMMASSDCPATIVEPLPEASLFDVTKPFIVPSECDISKSFTSQSTVRTSPITTLTIQGKQITATSGNVLQLQSDSQTPIILSNASDNLLPSQSTSGTIIQADADNSSNCPTVSSSNGSPQAGSKDILKCDYCEYSTLNKHYLKQHKDLVHTDERPYKCPFCDYAGKRSHSLKEHLVVHSNDRPFECNICNATFRKKGHLTNHIKMHSPSSSGNLVVNPATQVSDVDKSDPVFVCKLCDFNSTRQLTFMQHLSTHNPKGQAPKDTVSSSIWVSVNDSANSNVTENPQVPLANVVKRPVVLMKCTECGFTSRDKDLLKKHMWVHIDRPNVEKTPSAKVAVCTNEDSNVPIVSPTQASGTAFRCGECLHETTEAYKFIAHMLTHKSTSSAQKTTSAMANVFTPPKKPLKAENKVNSPNPQVDSSGFTHDKSVGRFCCNICGYTCDHQRTIKAHAWKHSGHKDIDYPMFQNGPVSIYDDSTENSKDKPKPTITSVGTTDVCITAKENHPGLKISKPVGPQITPKYGTVPVFKLLHFKKSNITIKEASSSSVEQPVPLALFSNGKENVVEVQTAMADSAKDLQSNDLNQPNLWPEVISETKSGVKHNFKTIHLDESTIKTLFPEKSDSKPPAGIKEVLSNSLKRSHPDGGKSLPGIHNQFTGDAVQTAKKFCMDNQESPNVVVERIHGVSHSLVYTGLRSQQNSPRGSDQVLICSDQHIDTSNPGLPVESVVEPSSSPGEALVSSTTTASADSTEHAIPEISEPVLLLSADHKPQYTEGHFQCIAEKDISKLLESGKSIKFLDMQTSPEEKMTGLSSALKNIDAKQISMHGESALTLLSLLQKSPNNSVALKEAADLCTTMECMEQNEQLSDTVVEVQEEQVVSVDEPSQTPEETVSTTVAESEVEESSEANKPKAGICSSLLAVIEQLRERSKSESETDDLSQFNVAGKRKPRRRNQRISHDTSCQLESMENVEKLEDIEMKYRCKLCHYTNSSPSLIKQHMRLHKTKKPFECSLCDFVADSSEPLQDHMIQHCKMRTYQCKLCPSAFNYKSQLRAHMRAHSEKDPFLCNSCNFETTNPIKFRLHTRMHTESSSMKCNTCDSVFKSQTELFEHVKEGCVPGIEYCDDCNFETSSKEELREHEHTHRKKNNCCPVCDVVCSSQSSLRLHVRTHEETQEMKCEMCNFLAASSRSLKSHMKRHVNDQRYVQQPLEQYKCNLCGYVCHHLPSLKSHMWRHASDKNYVYDLTNEVINAAIDYDSRQDVSNSTSSLTASLDIGEGLDKALNINSKEDSDKGDSQRKKTKIPCLITFRCCQCGFETISKYDLNEHMKVHSDIIRKTLEVSQSLSQSRIGGKRFIVESLFDSSQTREPEEYQVPD